MGLSKVASKVLLKKLGTDFFGPVLFGVGGVPVYEDGNFLKKVWREGFVLSWKEWEGGGRGVGVKALLIGMNLIPLVNKVKG